MERNHRVLSIQSHVVSGYVGNKSACFPLQVLGYDVDAINSVQLSNHTGYKYWKGQMLDAKDLRDVFEGLKRNNLHQYSHLLTGYVGTASFLSEVISVVKELRAANPDLYFVCDPVMGDNGHMYLPAEILPLYRDQLVSLADILTPNQFEAELLTDISIKKREDAFEAMQVLHNRGVETVIISSAKFDDSKTLTVLGSSVKGGKRSFIQMDIPQLDANFLGTGDFFAATILAWMTTLKGDLKLSCEMAVNSLQSVLYRTLAYAKEHAGPDGKLTPELLELKLIQSKDDIEHPKPLFTANVLA